MKIISWNCNMAFRKKVKHILVLQPDILIIPECECIENLKFGDNNPSPANILWFGHNKHKGLAVLSFGNIKLKVLDDHNQALKMIVPISVTGDSIDFNLFAVWANNPLDKEGQYVEQVWKALKYYDKLLLNKNTVLAGDFNSNTIWDKPRRVGNHSAVVKALAGKGIYSAYHLYYGQVQGKEMHSTFYLYRHKHRTNLLDYCFLTADLVDRLTNVVIGDHEAWAPYSDHVPVIIDLA